MIKSVIDILGYMHDKKSIICDFICLCNLYTWIIFCVFPREDNHGKIYTRKIIGVINRDFFYAYHMLVLFSYIFYID